LRFIKRHPFATYGVVALLVGAIGHFLNLQYDDGGIGSLLIISSPIWGVIYWAPQEILFSLNNGKSFYGQTAISIGVGFLICLLADYFLVNRKKRGAKQE